MQKHGCTILLPLKLLTCVLPCWTQSQANYGKNCIHYVQAEWNLSIEQICSKMVFSEPWTACEHHGQNATDVHKALLLYPITILIYDPSPYQTVYDHHGVSVKWQNWNRSWSCSHYAAAAANPCPYFNPHWDDCIHMIFKPLLWHGTSNLKEQLVLGCKALLCVMPLNTSLAGSPCQLQALCTMLWWRCFWVFMRTSVKSQFSSIF